jgi:hypothetical protein
MPEVPVLTNPHYDSLPYLAFFALEKEVPSSLFQVEDGVVVFRRF